ncbi:MAG: glycoside hydrolase family 3 C-terminal domain-containing protein, partial [Bacteroidales bacterium]|nr:glycoside hydrolase family 3 C-terminal domain-containing protein [Bacteroidales bacterium]
EWLKEGLNWDGMIVTDWADILNLCTRDRIAKDHKDAIRMAINAGIDMSMVTYTPEFCTLLKELVEEGAVKMSRIDDAVARILRLKYRLGLFEKPSWPCEDYDKFACEEFAEQAVEAARQSIVLLKNDNGILPIKEGTRILVTGPNANSMRCLNGGWSYTWQGHLGILPEYTEQYNTIYEALCNRFGAANVKYVPGVTYNESGLYWEENEPDIQAAVAAAASVDCIVVCVGENSYCETPGNLSDLALSENQRNLVKALAKSGKPIVMVLNEGRPRIIRDIVDCAGAIVDVMLPGNYGGDALSELLAGDCNFSGRLPFTYPKEPASLINYDYKPCENINGEMEGSYNYSASAVWQWGFGFGLSYTNFEYSALRCDKVKFNEGDVLNFKVDVKNAGKVAGYESVLLFASDLVATYTPDNRRLREFAKIWLEPGESKTVELSIKASDLAYVNEALEWVLEPGEFKIAVGTESIVIEKI